MRVAATKLATAEACSSFTRSACLYRLSSAPRPARLAAICQARQASRQHTGGSSSRKTHSSNGSNSGSSGEAEALLAGGEFHATFQQQWGDRWQQLFAALVAPTRHVALSNSPFLLRQLASGDLAGAAPLEDHRPQLAAVLQAACGRAGSYRAADGSACKGSSQHAQAAAAGGWVLHWEPPSAQDGAISYPPPPTDPATGLTTHYWLDAASLLPPLLLDVRPGQAVLDMCAAPGGKSLVLAQLLLGAEHRQAAAADVETALAEATAAGADAATESASAGSSAGSGGSGSEEGAAFRAQGEAERHLAGSAEAEDGDEDDGSSSSSSSSSRGTGSRRGQRGAAGGSGGWCGSSLCCNEIDAGRRARLVRVLRSYVPAAVRSCIRVTPYDAARWWGRQDGESFDRVLLDAPCSSDRHVAQQAAARGSAAIPRSDWSMQRCRRIAGDQAKLLAAGVKALRQGGRLVYSTCSIADLENDGAVDRLLDKAQGSVAVVSHTLAAPPDSGSSSSSSGAGAGAEGVLAALEAAGAERTRHGWLLLPDAAGCGPIYLCVLHKLASSDLRRVKVNKYRPA